MFLVRPISILSNDLLGARDSPPLRCSFTVFNSRLGRFATEQLKCSTHVRPVRELKGRLGCCSAGQSLSLTKHYTLTWNVIYLYGDTTFGIATHRTMTFSILTLRIMTFSITTLRTMAIGIITLRTMTFSIITLRTMAFSITKLRTMTFSIMAVRTMTCSIMTVRTMTFRITQNNDIQHKDNRYG